MGVLLLIHVFITLALIGAILIQRSEGGGLGLGGGGGAFTARGASNFLTRLTAILAAAFFSNCLLMAIVSNVQLKQSRSILEDRSVKSAVPADQDLKKENKKS